MKTMNSFQWIATASFLLLCAASAQARDPVYASDACRTGCFSINSESGNSLYEGAEPHSYRICSLTVFPATLELDGETIDLQSTTFNPRACIDINGTHIKLVSGTALAGLLP